MEGKNEGELVGIDKGREEGFFVDNFKGEENGSLLGTDGIVEGALEISAASPLKLSISLTIAPPSTLADRH